MASTTRQMTREFSIFDFGSLVRAVWMPAAATDGQAAGFFAGDDLTSRALASAGIAALVTLPFLLLSSIVLATPLAVPAAIGLGYLAVSHAMGSRRHRWAALINSAVLFGLVGWLLLFLTGGEGPLSPTSLIAALLAPAFAAAPALARSLIAKGRLQENGAAIAAREAALDRVTCLDQLAPSERTVFLDDEGSVLAATAAARGFLGLLPDAFEHSLHDLAGADDLPRLFDAIGHSRIGFPSVDLFVERIGEGAALTASFSACDDGMIAMRLEPAPASEPDAAEPERIAASPLPATMPSDLAVAPSCDVGDAIAFALRHAAKRAAARGTRLSFFADPDLVAMCDRQVGRRMACLLLDASLNSCMSGGAVAISAQRKKGVVLLRITTLPQKDARNIQTGLRDQHDFAELQGLVESAGGTLMVDRGDMETVLSARLPLAAQASTRGCGS